MRHACWTFGLLIALSLSATAAAADPTDGVWAQIAQTGPVPPGGLLLTAMAYDSARQRALYFAPLVGETWALDLAGTPTWSQITTSGTPPTVQQYAAFYDATGDRLIIIGDDQDNVWALSLGAGTPTWAGLSTPGHFSDASTSFAFDPAGRAFSFGGTHTFGTEFTGVLQQYAVGSNTWSVLSTPSGSPRARAAATLAYDPGVGRIFLHGGIETPPFTAFTPSADTWLFYISSSSWVQQADGPAMAFAASIFDPTRNRVVVFDGGDTWAFKLHSPEGWTHLSPDGTMDGSCDGMAAIYDPVNDRMVLFGGNGCTQTWQLVFDPSTPAAASVVASDVTPSLARLTWQVATGRDASVERRNATSEWLPLAQVSPDGQERIVYEDDSVVSGQRYGYRLRWASGATSIAGGEVWVDVPGALTLQMLGAKPNPASGPMSVAFVTPSPGEARLEVFDVRGRRVVAPNRVWLPAGSHLVRVGPSAGLPAGVYLTRVTFGGTSLWTRAVSMR